MSKTTQAASEASSSTDKIELSYSRINTYLACPFKYKLIYKNGWRIPPSPYISFGLTIHRTLEAYHKAGLDKLDDLIDMYEQSWMNEGYPSPTQAMEFHERGMKLLERYFEASQDQGTEIVFLEKDFAFPLEEFNFRGIIDRIDRHPDGTYEVVEYKTHLDMWDDQRVQSDLQLTLYAWACEKKLGLTPLRLFIYFLSHGKKVATSRTQAQYDRALCVIQEVGQKIRAQDFSPNHAHCPKCDFRNSCPEVKLDQ